MQIKIQGILFNITIPEGTVLEINGNNISIKNIENVKKSEEENTDILEKFRKEIEEEVAKQKHQYPYNPYVIPTIRPRTVFPHEVWWGSTKTTW